MDKYFQLEEQTVFDYIQKKLNFFATDAETVCEEIGDGNLNLVFRIKDIKNGKSAIIKQALPYVRAAGKDWPLNISRGEIESQVLDLEYKLTDGLVPQLYFYDSEMYCMGMEDLDHYMIMRYGLLEFNQYPLFSEQITDFLVKTLLLTSDVALEHQRKKEYVRDFINPELCKITEDLVYTEPFGDYPRNNMEDFLVDFSKTELKEDTELRLEVAKLKFEFMNNAQALLHGDLHTGSIFVNDTDTKVIDPEFAFYGPMAYDIGALIANLIMNYLSTMSMSSNSNIHEDHCVWLLKTWEECIDMFKSKFLNMWKDVVLDDMAKVEGFAQYYLDGVLSGTAGVAGCEMCRRTVGFAHVKDLDIIPESIQREKAKKNTLLIGKELIKERQNVLTGKDYTKIIAKYARQSDY